MSKLAQMDSFVLSIRLKTVGKDTTVLRILLLSSWNALPVYFSRIMEQNNARDAPLAHSAKNSNWLSLNGVLEDIYATKI